MRKNAQIGSLQGVIITLVVVGILLGVGFLIFQSLMNTTSTDTQYTITSETLPALVTTTIYPVHNSSAKNDCRFNNFAIVSVCNATSGLLITSANYTYDSTTGGIINATEDYTDTLWAVNYTYYSGGVACQGIEDTQDALNNVPTYLPILVIIIIIGIILAILFGIMPSFSRGGGGGSVAEV